MKIISTKVYSVTLGITLVLVGFVLLFIKPLWADLILPEIPKTYVSDFAGILPDQQKQALEQKLRTLEQQSSNQVLVVTVSSLHGLPIEDFSIRLAEKWKPGQADRDNGVILLVAPHERKVRIEVGYGLEGALPDATAKNIIEEEIIPAFKRGDYPGGISAGVEAVIAATRGEYQNTQEKADDDNDIISFVLKTIFNLFIVLILSLLIIFFDPLTFPLRYYFRNGRSFAGLERAFRKKFKPSKSGSYFSIGSSSSSSGFSGGFSSGGGSFGGGGASGSW